MTATAQFPSLTPAPSAAVTAFEADFAVKRREARRAWAIGTAVFLALFLLTAWLGDFFKVTQVTQADGSRAWRWVIPAGIPRLGEFIEKIGVDALRAEQLHLVLKPEPLGMKGLVLRRKFRHLDPQPVAVGEAARTLEGMPGEIAKQRAADEGDDKIEAAHGGPPGRMDRGFGRFG